MPDNFQPRGEFRGFDAEKGRAAFPLRMWEWTTARVLYTATVYLVLLYFLRAARETITLFLFAILFAYFLVPLVSRLEGPLRGRWKAILVVYVILIGALIGLGFLVGPKIAQEGHDLGASLPSLLNRLASGQLLQSFGQHHGWSAIWTERVQAFLTDHHDDILGYGKTIAAKLATPITHVWWLILIPILSLFLLNKGPGVAGSITSFVNDPLDRTVVEGVLADVNVLLGSYIRAQIILACLTLVAYTIALSILGVPYAFILSPLAGFLEFIPVVGPAIGAVSILIISILSGSPHVLGLLLFLAAWRLVQDYVNAPRVMGQSLEIDPLMQIFAVLTGAEIAGVVGALVSVPVVAILRIIWRRMHPNAPKKVNAKGEVYTGPARQ